MIINFFLEGLPYFLREKMHVRINFIFYFWERKIVGF